jgi:hypothetical protein
MSDQNVIYKHSLTSKKWEMVRNSNLAFENIGAIIRVPKILCVLVVCAAI